MFDSFLIQFHLLKRKQIEDICWASNVNEYPVDAKLFYPKNDYQWVIMRLPDVTIVSF